MQYLPGRYKERGQSRMKGRKASLSLRHTHIFHPSLPSGSTPPLLEALRSEREPNSGAWSGGCTARRGRLFPALRTCTGCRNRPGDREGDVPQ